MKASDLQPASLQTEYATARDLGLKPHVSGKSRFTTKLGCPACGGGLETQANSGIKTNCLTCGKSGIILADLGKDNRTPAAIDQPTASPEIQPPDESPVLDNVEPPQVEWTEPEIPAGREPGSDDEPEPTKPDAEFMWLDEFCKQPSETSWLIRGYLESDCLAILFGDSQAGKSFVAIDISCHVAHGLKWCGKRTKKGKVLYIAAEGKNGLKRRFKAWHEFHKLPIGKDVVVRTIPAKLCDIEHTQDLVKRIKSFLVGIDPELIIVDTLNRNFGNGDENKTQDMSKFIDGMNELKLSTNACVAALHHVGHGNKDRGRGSISLYDAVDFEYRIERAGDPEFVETLQTTMIATKWKDSAKPKELAWNWNLKSLPWLELDDNDQLIPVNSIVLTQKDYDPKANDNGLTHQQQIALKAIGCALATVGIEANGLVTVDKDQWQQQAYELGISKGEQDAKRIAFNRAEKELTASGRVRKHDGRYWIPPNRTNRT